MEIYFKTVITVLTALIGLCIGSFLNVVIYRLPNKMSLATPPSHCPKCNYQLHWYDNIPILSYILLGGKCRGCKEPISPRYLCVEAANMVLWILSLLVFGFGQGNYVYAYIVAVAISVMICIFFIDLEHMIIFDRFQIILGVLAVASLFFDKSVDWLSRLVGCVLGGGVFLLVSFFISLKKGKEALGGGDVKFAFIAGFFLGWQKLILMMLIASVSASVSMLIQRKKYDDEEGKEYPFGPYLTAATTLCLLFGRQIVDWYIALIF